MVRKLGWLLLCLVVSSTSAFAQSKTGTSIGQFLLIEPGARFAAMGNAGVAQSGGIQSVYYNPAAAGDVDGFGLQFTHIAWIADIGLEYAAAGLPFRDWGTLYATVTALNSGDIDVRTVEQPLGTGERYSVSDFALGLGLGRRFTDRFTGGLQINYIQESIWHSSLKTVTVSMGTCYDVTDRGLKIGASISNFGTKSSFSGRDLSILYDNDPDRYGDNSALPGHRATDDFPVPLLFRLGVTMPYQLSETGNLLLALDAHHPSYGSESLNLGGEWTWQDMFALRAGYQGLFQDDLETGPTFGAGFAGHWDEQTFHFDYAWADQGRLDQAHRFTFVLDF